MNLTLSRLMARSLDTLWTAREVRADAPDLADLDLRAARSI